MRSSWYVFLLDTTEGKIIFNLEQTMRYIRPPDALVTQIDVYTEEKFEDEEDQRERSKYILKKDDGDPELASIFNILAEVSIRHAALRTSLLDSLSRLAYFLDKETTL